MFDALVDFGLQAGTKGGRNRYLDALVARSELARSIGAFEAARADLRTALAAAPTHSHAFELEVAALRDRLAALDADESS